MADRPLGITILAVLEIIGGISGVIGGIAIMSMSDMMEMLMGPLAPFIGILGFLAFIFGIASLVIGWGLWTMKPWARRIAVIFAGIGIIMAFVQMVAMPMPTGVSGAVMSIIINGVIIWYLSKPEIKTVFGEDVEVEHAPPLSEDMVEREIPKPETEVPANRGKMFIRYGYAWFVICFILSLIGESTITSCGDSGMYLFLLGLFGTMPGTVALLIYGGRLQVKANAMDYVSARKFYHRAGAVWFVFWFFLVVLYYAMFWEGCSSSSPQIPLILFISLIAAPGTLIFMRYGSRLQKEIKKAVEPEAVHVPELKPMVEVQPPPAAESKPAPDQRLGGSLQAQIEGLKEKDADVYLDDINDLISEAEGTLSEESLDEARRLIEEKNQLVDRRKELMVEFENVSHRLNSLAGRVADGEISDETFRAAKEEFEMRKVEIQDELGEIDYKLYKEEYEKPVF